LPVEGTKINRLLIIALWQAELMGQYKEDNHCAAVNKAANKIGVAVDDIGFRHGAKCNVYPKYNKSL